MFQKPAFGANTSGFGMQSSFGASPSTSASPFGGFKPTTGASTFGAPPAFGASTSAQPTAGGGLFGTTNTSGGLFGGGAAAAPAPAFGAATTGFGFGTSTSAAGGGLFANNTSSGLFGATQQNNAFGAKPAGFGFGSTPTNQNQTSGLFGNTTTPGSGLFGQQNTTLGGGGLFSNTAGGFGQQQQAPGTGHVKYSPVVGTDVVVKSGTSQNINIKHHCITCMKEYESKSLEELRLEDYTAGRKSGGGAMFPFQQQQPAQAKPLFGGTTTFGQPATTSAPSVFGGGGMSAGGAFGQTNTFSFGNNTQTSTSTTGLFGANKPAFGATATPGTGIFGAPATTQPPAFGTTTSTFGFGNNLQNQTTGGGIFGAKPATSVFGSQPATAGFGGFGAGGGLFAKPLQTQAPTFGAPQPGIGTQALGFGAFTSTSNSLGTMGFGKPTTTQPSFGFGTTQPTLGVGLGANAFQNKPAQPFGQLGGTSMFPTNNANNNFRTGLDSGLGSGIFGNNSGLGTSSLGLGMSNSNAFINNNLSGASAAGNVHEQILALAARPYGDSPLFKDILPDSSTTAGDMLKPTNPAAMQAVLDKSQNSVYRITSPTEVRLKVHPKTARAHDKKSLFDGLEESDPSLEDKLSLKPSRKRLVLRPKQTESNNNSIDASQQGVSFRSHEDQSQHQLNGNSASKEKENTSTDHVDNADRIKRNISFPDNNNSEISSERQGSWLNSSKLSWSDNKEKPIDNEPTPRLYPNLDKELPLEGSERRASWLTTKPLQRKAVVSSAEVAENSVRELGVKSMSGSPDKENLEILEELEAPTPREGPPHPAGVKLTRPGYYTIPSLEEMVAYMRPDGSCVVPHLTIGRKNYGNVYYDCEINVTGMDLDNLVHFLNKEVIVYPSEQDKPPLGSGLNTRAIVTLDRVWPRDKTDGTTVTHPDRLWEYELKLRRVCDKHQTKFIEYRPQTGSWVFRVEHFSKYGLTDSDDEDDIAPEAMKRQLVNQALQKSAPGLKPPVSMAPAGLGGLGGLGGLPSPLSMTPGLGMSSSTHGMPTSGLGMNPSGLTMGPSGLTMGPSGLTMAPSGLSMPPTGHGMSSSGLGGHMIGMKSPGLGSESSIYAMQQASLNLLNGASRAYEMDTTEDNGESQSLYQDHKAFGVKSPTSELARLENRQSHHVQLMKASLYPDTEMDEDVSISTGDQLVPMWTPMSEQGAVTSHSNDDVSKDVDTVTPHARTEEAEMRPLIVRPHTIVLKYHRKIPPFNQTIAGRMDAASISDMSVCRARHSRVGFGANGTLTFPTSYDSIVDLPKSSELSALEEYTRGRQSNDWSEPVVARIALQQVDNNFNMQEILSQSLDTLFQYSTFIESPSEECPRLQLVDSPRERRAALLCLMRHSRNTNKHTPRFGVTGAYCYGVWKLCDALWGADLENDGMPGTDDLSIVNRHRHLLQWMMSAVSDVTDRDLAQPRKGETEDEEDGHSARVWTLLVGGRVLEACKLAKEKGDLNLATLIAQSAGDPSFRSLLNRQLSLWRECGADNLISGHKRAIIQLIAGVLPAEYLGTVEWTRALYATARYLCTPVPSLEQIIRTYEGYFSSSSSPSEVDLTTVDEDAMGMQLPVPQHTSQYHVVVAQDGKQRRVLDLRYELIRSRAFNTRPKLQPEQYTQDPLDYSLCFLLGVWFGNASPVHITNVAAQLEASGAWELAVNALSYLPDGSRGRLIRNVLSRHAPAKVDTPELKARMDLIKKLRVPEKWVLLAQAHRAKYEHLPALEAEYLAGAEHWNEAHKVLLEELLPEAVLADNLQSIAPLLEKMNEAASRHELSGWSSGGQALHQYLHVCHEVSVPRVYLLNAWCEYARGRRGQIKLTLEIRGLVSCVPQGTSRAAVQARLAALRPAVSAASRALTASTPKTPRHALARAEMGARLVQLAVAAGEPPHHLAALLRALKLPPDCTAQAQHKITTELAEQASELCIESATSSPISSHHRATAAS